ncbi:MAG: HisA/HisF-related TIM barrel protein [Steroidobacteraceae bacterium]
MLKRRLVGVITVKKGWAVQSFGFVRHLPLGRPEVIAQNLDRWGADEILVLCIDRTLADAGPDIDLVRRIGRMGLSTPVTYGGGLRSVDDGMAVIQAGAERVCIDAMLWREPMVVRALSARIGAQALIGALPVSRSGQTIAAYDYLSRTERPITTQTRALFAQQVISEALIIDWQHEGHARGFDTDLVRRWPLPGVPLIAFGGISEPEQLEELFCMEGVVAAGVGNFLAYREHAIQNLKERVRVPSVRPAEYECKP